MSVYCLMYKFFKNQVLFCIGILVACLDIVMYRKRGILFHGYQGVASGNALAFFEHLSASHENLPKADIWWTGHSLGGLEYPKFVQTPPRGASVFRHATYLIFLARFRVIAVAGAGDLSFYLRFLSNSRRLKVLLTHGFGLKSMGVLSPTLSPDQKRIWSNMGKRFNLLSASSKLERYILSSTLNVDVSNVVVMGPQRDMASGQYEKSEIREARDLIKRLYGNHIDETARIIIYAPTHRDHRSDQQSRTLFGFTSNDDLNHALSERNSYLIMRSHRFSKNNMGSGFSNLINSGDAESVDFSKLAPAAETLITDYSGIFLEYLTSEIKIGFWRYDLDDYRKERGFSISESIFKCGDDISNEQEFIRLIDMKGVSKAMMETRLDWHNQLYELSNEAALRETSKEIAFRARIDLSKI
ncbi:CDP-glycerol glycerophosphotransferase family protein [Alphaproteobacteria bacterium]|nr:CDP-glycerol glycerophosphotransferase family protein [Alphaproteobacteria bacterium]